MSYTITKPSEPLADERNEAFCQLMARGFSPSLAYEEVYPEKKESMNSRCFSSAVYQAKTTKLISERMNFLTRNNRKNNSSNMQKRFAQLTALSDALFDEVFDSHDNSVKNPEKLKAYLDIVDKLNKFDNIEFVKEVKELEEGEDNAIRVIELPEGTSVSDLTKGLKSKITNNI